MMMDDGDADYDEDDNDEDDKEDDDDSNDDEVSVGSHSLYHRTASSLTE